MRKTLIACLPLLLLTAMSADDPVARAAEAIGRGADGGTADRAAAGAILSALGARPADGETDLASSWRTGKGAPAYRDRVLGPVYRKVSLRPHATAVFEQTFFGGRRARVAVVALDQTPYGLVIRDDEGTPQCDPAQSSCAWVPAWTTRFRVELGNRSTKPAAFFLVMQ